MLINTLTTERLLEHNGIPVIRLTSSIPIITGGKKRAVRRINAFYGHIDTALEKYLRRHMLKLASADFDDAVANSRPFEPYRVKMTFEATLHDEILIINRRLYTRTRSGMEHECNLTEYWNTIIGLPEKIKMENVDYKNAY